MSSSAEVKRAGEERIVERTFKQGQKALRKLDKLLKAARDLKPGDDLIQARRELASPSMVALEAFNIHNIKNFECTERVNRWLSLLPFRPHYLNDETAKLDLSIFSEPPFSVRSPYISEDEVAGDIQLQEFKGGVGEESSGIEKADLEADKVKSGKEGRGLQGEIGGDGGRDDGEGEDDEGTPGQEKPVMRGELGESEEGQSEDEMWKAFEEENGKTFGPDVDADFDGQAVTGDEKKKEGRREGTVEGGKGAVKDGEMAEMADEETEGGKLDGERKDEEEGDGGAEDDGDGEEEEEDNGGLDVEDEGENDAIPEDVDDEGEQDAMPEDVDDDRRLKRKTPEQDVDMLEEDDDEEEPKDIKKRKIEQSPPSLKGQPTKTRPDSNAPDQKDAGAGKRRRKRRTRLLICEDLELNENPCDRCKKSYHAYNGKWIHQPCYKQPLTKGKKTGRKRRTCHVCSTRKQGCSKVGEEGAESGVEGEEEDDDNELDGEEDEENDDDEDYEDDDADEQDGNGEEEPERKPWVGDREGRVWRAVSTRSEEEGDGGEEDDHAEDASERAGNSRRSRRAESEVRKQLKGGWFGQGRERKSGKANPITQADMETEDVEMSIDEEAPPTGARVGGIPRGRTASLKPEPGTTRVQPSRSRRHHEAIQMAIDESVGRSRSVSRAHSRPDDRPRVAIASRKVSPAPSRPLTHGNMYQQMGSFLPDRALTEGKLTDIQSDVRVLQRTQDLSRQAILSRVDEVLVDHRVLAREHGARLDALEAIVGTDNESFLRPLMEHFERLETKMEDVKRGVQATSLVRQTPSDVATLASLGGGKGLHDAVRVEISKAVATSFSMMEVRMQAEIAQRFDSLSQVILKELAEQDKRNEARQTYLLTHLTQQTSNMGDVSKISMGRSQNSASTSYGGSYQALSYSNSAFPTVDAYLGAATARDQSYVSLGSEIPTVPTSRNPATGPSTSTFMPGQHSTHSGVDSHPSISNTSYPAGQFLDKGRDGSNLGRVGGNQGSLPNSYFGGSMMDMSPSVFNEPSFEEPGPADSISQRRPRDGNTPSTAHSHQSRATNFGMASESHFSIRTSATDGSRTSSVARDGGVPHPLRMGWGVDASILTSAPGSAASGGSPEES